MKISQTLTLGLLCLPLATFQEPPVHAQEISQQEFDTLRKELIPDADQPWRTIPWKISLLDAQRLAGQQQKPIFIWAMDGHPLGCT